MVDEDPGYDARSATDRSKCRIQWIGEVCWTVSTVEEQGQEHGVAEQGLPGDPGPWDHLTKWRATKSKGLSEISRA